MSVKLKRAYESPTPDDGDRYLVERLWPRGVTKSELALTGWVKDLAPSTDLRKWYGHKEELWPEFAERYKSELRAGDKQELLLDLARRSTTQDVTLVFATKLVQLSGAVVLKEVVEDLAARSA